MNKYFVGSIVADGRTQYTRMPMSRFIEDTGIELDTEEVSSDDDIDTCTDDEIAEYVENIFDGIRYEMGIDVDTAIIYTGFKIVDEDDFDI